MELQLAAAKSEREKQKALALVVELVGRKRLLRYLDAQDKTSPINTLDALKAIVRRRRQVVLLQMYSPSPTRDDGSLQSSPESVFSATSTSNGDAGAWWSSRSMDEVGHAQQEPGCGPSRKR